jgi:hypothetical protein
MDGAISIVMVEFQNDCAVLGVLASKPGSALGKENDDLAASIKETAQNLARQAQKLRSKPATSVKNLRGFVEQAKRRGKQGLKSLRGRQPQVLQH